MERQASASLKTVVLMLSLGLTACANVEAPYNQEPARFAAPVAIGTSQPVLAALPPSASFPASTDDGQTVAEGVAVDGDGARLIRVSKRLNCVQFSRMQSGIQVAGNAGTWWDHAKGKYERDTAPQVGSVMVFSSTKRLHSGHVAVVRSVMS